MSPFYFGDANDGPTSGDDLGVHVAGENTLLIDVARKNSTGNFTQNGVDPDWVSDQSHLPEQSSCSIYPYFYQPGSPTSLLKESGPFGSSWNQQRRRTSCLQRTSASQKKSNSTIRKPPQPADPF
jgi:hypothetical protein